MIKTWPQSLKPRVVSLLCPQDVQAVARPKTRVLNLRGIELEAMQRLKQNSYVPPEIEQKTFFVHTSYVLDDNGNTREVQAPEIHVSSPPPYAG